MASLKKIEEWMEQIKPQQAQVAEQPERHRPVSFHRKEEGAAYNIKSWIKRNPEIHPIPIET